VSALLCLVSVVVVWVYGGDDGSCSGGCGGGCGGGSCGCGVGGNKKLELVD